ncbi:hypothetical protein [Neptuniibacter halophilus]|uniref:hypothetical protein n=1 Tax=Neptuniibacter halophilus TaxID=651666 RepID=UPI002573F228|nr:hypothetical protein [Neptuniibacter halophilus]
MWEKENKIWCDGLFGSKGLHCDGWPEDFGDYFLSPIKSKWFPAQGSSEILNVYAYGGAAHCANGVHRLLGGMVVLLKEFGDKAFLNQVNVTYHPLKVGAAEILDLALKENLKVESNGDFIRLRRLIGPFATYDARNKDALVECSPRDVKLAEKVEEKWKRMPREVIEKLLKNDWLHSQLLPAGGLTLEPVLETS